MSVASIYIDKAKYVWNHAGFQKYFRNTGWMFVGRVLGMTISFIATLFIARNLGPNNFGHLSYAISFISIFSFIASLGTDNIIYRELVKNPTRTKEILGSAFLIRITAGLLTAGLIVILAFFLGQDDVSKIAIYILSTTFIFNSFLIVSYEFQAKVQSKFPAIIYIFVSLILNILKIAVIYYDKGVIFLSMVLAFEPILYIIFYSYFYKKVIKSSMREWSFDKSIAKKILSDSWPLIFSSAFALVYSRIDQILIKYMLGAYSVGIYDAAVRVAEVWYFVPSIIVASLFPAIVNAKIVSEQIYFSRLINIAKLLSVMTLIVALMISFLSPFIINLLYGSDFMDASLILKIYVWSGVAIALGNLVNNYLITENYRKILFLSFFIPAILNIILNLLWIPKYELVGAAYATIISYSVGPLMIIFFKKTRQQIYSVIKNVRK